MFRHKGMFVKVCLSHFSIIVLLSGRLIITSEATEDQYIGCFYDKDQLFFPSLPVINSTDHGLNIERCITECGKSTYRYTYAVLENGNTCRCQNDLGFQLSDGVCNITCSGNQRQYCGGIVIDQTPSYVVYTVCPIGNYGPMCDEACHCKRQIPCERATGMCPNGCHGNWTGLSCNNISILPQYIGCYWDNGNDRDLSECAHCIFTKENPALNNTLEFCIETCAERNFSYAGTEIGVECFCGDSYGRYGQDNDTGCNMYCAGGESQICGGDIHNSIYSVCPVGSYGKDCLGNCNCFDNERCIYGNGSCPSFKCKPGWKGPNCSLRDCMTLNGDCYSNETCLMVDLKYSTTSKCRCSKDFQRNKIWDDCTDFITSTAGPETGLLFSEIDFTTSNAGPETEGLTQKQKNIILGVCVGIGGAVLLVILLTVFIYCNCVKKSKQGLKYSEEILVDGNEEKLESGSMDHGGKPLENLTTTPQYQSLDPLSMQQSYTYAMIQTAATGPNSTTDDAYYYSYPSQSAAQTQQSQYETLQDRRQESPAEYELIAHNTS